MLFYRFNRDPDDVESRWVYAPTLAAVRPIAREQRHHSFQPVVEEIDVSTDKLSMTLMLNGAEVSAAVRRAWDITRRGALKLMDKEAFADYLRAYHTP